MNEIQAENIEIKLNRINNRLESLESGICVVISEKHSV